MCVCVCARACAHAHVYTSVFARMRMYGRALVCVRDFTCIMYLLRSDFVPAQLLLHLTYMCEKMLAQTCAIVFTSDDIPPVIECPSEVIREFTTEGEVINVQFAPDLVTLSDNSAASLTPVFDPPQVTFIANAGQLMSSFPPSRNVNVTATVQDTTGNQASCRFELHFRRESFGCLLVLF